MPCYSPLKGWIVGVDSVTGKKIVKVTSPLDRGYPGFESFPVPCGHCIGCRLDYSRQWANRCMLEAQYHERSCFVTLTYDNDHVPKSLYVLKGKSGSSVALTLCKRDLQLFFKRLRKSFSPGRFRYFGCGEYGPRTLRPHYHLILFGIDFSDRVLYGRSKTGNNMYVSEALNRAWSFPPDRGECDSPRQNSTCAGLAIVQDMTWETCAYAARYLCKKLLGPLGQFYSEHRMEPPFSVMSRRPGIGARYYVDHPELWQHDFINVSTPDGGMKFRPPKYFVDLLERDDPFSAEALKEVRKAFALQQSSLIEDLSFMDYDQYLHRQEDIKSAEIKLLKRGAL